MKHVFLYVLYLIRSLLNPVFRFREVSVLAYHSISDDAKWTSVSKEAFSRHLALLKRRGYAFVPLSEVVVWQRGKGMLPQKVVAVTFDDGYADFETVALPVLEEYKIPATLFIVEDRETYRRTLGTPLPMLDAGAVERIRKHPLVELGYHTKTHPDLRTLSKEQLRDECTPLTPMSYFAYPGGNYSDEARQMLAELGYEAAFSIKPEPVRKTQDPMLLPRPVVTRSTLDWELCALVSVASTWYRTVRRTLRYG